MLKRVKRRGQVRGCYMGETFSGGRGWGALPRGILPMSGDKISRAENYLEKMVISFYNILSLTEVTFNPKSLNGQALTPSLSSWQLS